MLILGVLMLVAAVVVMIGGLFVSDGWGINMYGFDASPATLFLLGVVSAVVFLLGLRLTLIGTKRDFKARREQRKVNKAQAGQAPSTSWPNYTVN